MSEATRHDTTAGTRTPMAAVLGATAGTRASLVAMHLAVATVVVAAFRQTTPM